MRRGLRARAVAGLAVAVPALRLMLAYSSDLLSRMASLEATARTTSGMCDIGLTSSMTGIARRRQDSIVRRRLSDARANTEVRDQAPTGIVGVELQLIEVIRGVRDWLSVVMTLHAVRIVRFIFL